MLNKIKLLLNRPDDDSIDELLSTLIVLCKEEACVYCHYTEYNDRLDFVVMQMVIERFNRIGSEGAISQSTSGVSTSYDSFYSDKVVKLLNARRRLVIA